MSSVTVWLLHPNKLFREGLKRILADSPFTVTAEMAGVQDSRTLAGGPGPDLILLDLGGEGEAATLRQLREQLPACRLVVLAGELNTQRLTAALEAGIDG